MPILAYFVFVGTTLIGLLLFSSYELPDVGSPIKTSQIAGLPKVETRPDREPVTVGSSYFAAAEKESQALQSVNGIHAEQISGIHAEQINAHKPKSAHPVKRQQTERNSTSITRDRRIAEYSHDVVMGIH